MRNEVRKEAELETGRIVDSWLKAYPGKTLEEIRAFRKQIYWKTLMKLYTRSKKAG